MGRTNEPPFSRGATWYNGDTIPSSAQLALCQESPGGFNLEGKEYEFEDIAYGTGQFVTCRVCRNSAAYNIKPGQLVTFSTARYDGVTVALGTNTAGISAVEAAWAFPADEFLPPAGVPPGDLFYIIVEGPVLVKTAATAPGTISAGGWVVASTGVTTGDGNEGTVIAQDLSAITDGAETTIAQQIQNRLGRALSAYTSGQTGEPLLIDVGF